jgi:hypothetical protein
VSGRSDQGRAALSAWAISSTAVTIGLLAALTAIGGLLRFYHLGYESLWLDELGEATVATGPWSTLLPGVAQRAGDAPLDYLGIRVVTSVIGHGTTATRAWSWACGVAAIVAIAWLISV